MNQRRRRRRDLERWRSRQRFFPSAAENHAFYRELLSASLALFGPFVSVIAQAFLAMQGLACELVAIQWEDHEQIDPAVESEGEKAGAEEAGASAELAQTGDEADGETPSSHAESQANTQA